MDRQKTFVDYVKDIFRAFGVCTVIMTVYAYFLGDMVEDYSPLLSLGSKGVPLDTLAELFLLSILGTLERFIFFSDKIFKRAGKVFRTVSMVSTVIITAIVFIILFKWFPYDSPYAWLGFFVSFAVTFVLSLVLCKVSENRKNRKLDEALEKIKRKDDDKTKFI